MLTLIAADSPLLNHDLIFWGAIVLICVVPSLSYYLYRWRKSEIDAELKREMIARGMPADEIERVLAAGSTARSNRSGSESAGLRETQDYKS